MAFYSFFFRVGISDRVAGSSQGTKDMERKYSVQDANESDGADMVDDRRIFTDRGKQIEVDRGRGRGRGSERERGMQSEELVDDPGEYPEEEIEGDDSGRASSRSSAGGIVRRNAAQTAVQIGPRSRCEGIRTLCLCFSVSLFLSVSCSCSL